jgi:hypothetical protein
MPQPLLLAAPLQQLRNNERHTRARTRLCLSCHVAMELLAPQPLTCNLAALACGSSRSSNDVILHVPLAQQHVAHATPCGSTLSLHARTMRARAIRARANVQLYAQRVRARFSPHVAAAC